MYRLDGYTDVLNPYALDFPVCVPDDADKTGSSSVSGYEGHMEGVPTDDQTPSSSVHVQTGRRHGRLSAQARMQVRINEMVLKARQRHIAKKKKKEGEATASTSSTAQTAELHLHQTVAVSPAERATSSVQLPPLQCLREDQEQGGGGRPVHPTHPLWARKQQAELVGGLPPPVPYDPCTEDYMMAYMNLPDVQDALHVSLSFRPTFPGRRGNDGSDGTGTGTGTPAAKQPDSSNTNPTAASESEQGHSAASILAKRDPTLFVKWNFCSDVVFGQWTFNDYVADTTHLYSDVYSHRHKPQDFKMLVYSGDSDGVCATVGTQNWVYTVVPNTTKVQSLYQPWSYLDSRYHVQQGGYLTQFPDGLSFATVHYAGHEVPAYQPEKALEMFSRFLDGSLFDKTSIVKE